jgi:hypothetical protein
MLDEIFDRTVDALEYVSDKTGISYKKLNVILMIGSISIIGILLIIKSNQREQFL